MAVCRGGVTAMVRGARAHVISDVHCPHLGGHTDASTPLSQLSACAGAVSAAISTAALSSSHLPIPGIFIKSPPRAAPRATSRFRRPVCHSRPGHAGGSQTAFGRLKPLQLIVVLSFFGRLTLKFIDFRGIAPMFRCNAARIEARSPGEPPVGKYLLPVPLKRAVPG